MNIWIDIGHIPQHNFYRNFIKLLSDKGHRVYVSVLGRGRLPKIVHHDLDGIPNVSISVVGKHRMTKLSAIVDVNMIRFLILPFWLMGKHIDTSFANGHHGAIMSHIFRFPAFTFGDDPQTKAYWFFVHCATKSHMLIYEDSAHLADKKDHVFPCLKEWAYLNPRDFKPNVHALDKYGVQPKQYIFLREVSVGTVNYARQSAGAIRDVAQMIERCANGTSRFLTEDKKMKVLFSLEEKQRRNEYPEDWILLQEPIEDIHSLMYYAAGLVSSGDSMAREAALLGIPAYYLGIRHSMPANLAASKVANLQNEKTKPFGEWLDTIVHDRSIEDRNREQEKLRAKIDSEFIDINQYMLSLVENNRTSQAQREK